MPAAYDAEDLNRKFGQIGDRLRAIESQLAILSSKLDVPYDQPAAEAPPEVQALVAAGDSMGAIKKYRELTGADLETAQKAVGAI